VLATGDDPGQRAFAERLMDGLPQEMLDFMEAIVQMRQRQQGS
jgi:hypothetical protein